MREQEWWEKRKIDPLAIANRLWQQRREQSSAAREDDRAEALENGADRRTDVARPIAPDATSVVSTTGLADANRKP